MFQKKFSDLGLALDTLVEQGRTKWKGAKSYAQEAIDYQKKDLVLDPWYLAHFVEEAVARRLAKGISNSTFLLWVTPVEMLEISIEALSPESKVDLGPYANVKEMAIAIHDWAELALKHQGLLKARHLHVQNGGKMRPTPATWNVEM